MVCVVTGGSSGIGQAAACGLAAVGAHVALVCRDPVRGQAARERVAAVGGGGSVELYIADLLEQRQVRHLADRLLADYLHLDVLLNNAGAYFRRRQLTVDGVEHTFALNHLAYFLLTTLLLPRLMQSAPARVINVSSAAERMGSIEWNNLQGGRRYRGWAAYSASKLSNVLFTAELARRLRGSGVTANCLHPGVVRTGFWREMPLLGLLMRFSRSPEKGAETAVWLATDTAVDGVSGCFFKDRHPITTSLRSDETEIARALWELSDHLVGNTRAIGD